MTEIKRYTLDSESGPMSCSIQLLEHSEGEWVRWEDVKDIVDLARDAVTLKVFQEHKNNKGESMDERLASEILEKEIEFINQHKETLIKAWIAQTGVSPKESVLCVRQELGVTRVWIERKDEQESTSS
jgi:hypothetical protein